MGATSYVAQRLVIPAVGRLEWESFPLPEQPTPHQVIVRAEWSLVSIGTEMAIFTGAHTGFSLANPPFQLLPNHPGYAMVGRIVAVGDEVTGLAPGQRVLAEAPHGTHAVVDSRHMTLFPLPDGLDSGTATLLRMAYIALSAPRTAPLQLGEQVAVFGLGLVGQLAAQLYRLNGAGSVVGVDRLATRLAVAQAQGIRTVDAGAQPAAETVAAVTELTGGGADVTVEATGSPAVVSLCLDATRRGGRTVLLGSTRGAAQVDVYSHIHRRGVRLLGAHEGVQQMEHLPAQRWRKDASLALLADLFLAQRLRADSLLDRTVMPAQLPQLYAELAENPHGHLGILIDWRDGL